MDKGISQNNKFILQKVNIFVAFAKQLCYNWTMETTDTPGRQGSKEFEKAKKRKDENHDEEQGKRNS